MIIVVSVILVVLLMRGPDAESQVADETDPQSYIESCVKDSLEEVVEILMKQGGYVNPLEYKMHDNENISYLCYNNNLGEECIVLESDLKLHLENEIDNYLEPRIEACFSTLKIALTEKNYIVEINNLMNFKSEIKPGQIIVNIDREFESTKRGSQQKIDNFKLGYVYPAYEFSFHTMNILSNEAFPGNCYDNKDFDYLFYSKNNPPLTIERVLDSEDVRIYILKLNQYEFKFAIKGCVK